MSESTKEIQKRIERRRAQMGEKIAALEKKVLGPVKDVQEVAEDVQETAEETVKSAKKVFNVSRHFRKRPWLMLGGSALVGYLGGRLLPSLRPATAPASESASGSTASQPSADSTSDSAEDSSWSRSISDALGLQELKEQAIAQSMSVLKGLLISAVPENVQDNLTSVMQKLDERMGKMPSQEESSHSRAPSHNGKAEE